MFYIKRTPNIIKWLDKNKGGHWKYDRSLFMWICDDGRYVCKVGNNDDIFSDFRYCMYYAEYDKKSEWLDIY